MDSPSAGLKQTRVLLIEDDEDDYVLTAAVLEEAAGDYALTWERDPTRGLAALASGEYDACLLDYRLSGTTGLDVLAQAAALEVNTPIIMLTGQSDRDTDVAVMRAGAADYLVKAQLDASILERSIRYAVGRALTMGSLAESERRARSLMESAGDGIVITDAAGTVSSWNAAAASMFGAVDLNGTALEDLLRSASGTPLPPVVQPGAAAAQPFEAVRADGSTFPAEVTFSTWPSSEGAMWSAIIRDVTERDALQAQLAHQAFHDPLTGLANRSLLRARLDDALARTGEGRSAAVLFLDLDDFKRVNDTLGHAVGDALLQQVARRIQNHVRAGDTVARLGGDEFAVVLVDIEDIAVVHDAASRIVDALRQPFSGPGSTVQISVSIGVALGGADRREIDTLLRDADVAMYAAKSQGKRRYTFFESEMHARIVHRHNLERDLRRSLEHGGIVAFYQPIVDFGADRVAGLEALVRWAHPERGLLSPDQFLGIAEESGLIVELGRVVRDQAFAQASAWGLTLPGRPVHVAVNVSPRELEDANFVPAFFAALDRARLASNLVVVEVVESVMLRDRSRSIRRLESLRDGGVRIAIDDFGTGYSSLSYVHELPAEIVKIDRSFVQRLGSKGGDSVVGAVVAMSHDLGLLTIAEGIDDDLACHRLRVLGCDLGQGYRLAPPGDAAAVTPLLTLRVADLIRHDRRDESAA